MEEFIRELMQKIDGNIRVKHQGNLPFKLPRDNERNLFLDELFRPFLDAGVLENKQKEALKSWPVYFSVPSGIENFSICLEGELDAYAPKDNASGDPRSHLEDAVEKGIDNKRDSNNLNGRDDLKILAINYLLSADYQASCSALTAIGGEFPRIDFGESLDAVLLASCGIDCELSSNEPLSIFTHLSKEEAQKRFCMEGVNFVEMS